MEKSLNSIIPDPSNLLSMEPEDFSGVLLEILNYVHENGESNNLNRNNFISSQVESYPVSERGKISEAIMEAWVFLQREGLIANKPASPEGWIFITRRGKKISSIEDFKSFRKSNLLPKEILHPKIVVKCFSLFLRGEYDTAIFQAFKEVEVAVRNAGGFDNNDYGVPLMRKAFHSEHRGRSSICSINLVTDSCLNKLITTSLPN